MFNNLGNSFNNQLEGFKTSMFGGQMSRSQNFQNEDWKLGYTASFPDIIKKMFPEPRMYNCVFKTTDGKNFIIPFSESRTGEDLILTFFKRVDREELFQNRGVGFIYNAEAIDYHTKRKTREIFKTNTNPVIMVIDVQNLIGA